MKEYWVVVASVEELEDVLNRAAYDDWKAITVHPPESTRVTTEYRSGQRCRIVFERNSRQSSRKRTSPAYLNPESIKSSQPSQKQKPEKESVGPDAGNEVDNIVRTLALQSLN